MRLAQTFASPIKTWRAACTKKHKHDTGTQTEKFESKEGYIDNSRAIGQLQ